MLVMRVVEEEGGAGAGRPGSLVQRRPRHPGGRPDPPLDDLPRRALSAGGDLHPLPSWRLRHAARLPARVHRHVGGRGSWCCRSSSADTTSWRRRWRATRAAPPRRGERRGDGGRRRGGDGRGRVPSGSPRRQARWAGTWALLLAARGRALSVVAFAPRAARRPRLPSSRQLFRAAARTPGARPPGDGAPHATRSGPPARFTLGARARVPPLLRSSSLRDRHSTSRRRGGLSTSSGRGRRAPTPSSRASRRACRDRGARTAACGRSRRDPLPAAGRARGRAAYSGQFTDR